VVNLLDFDRDALTAHCERLGEKPFRAVQLFRWIHQRGAADFAQMTDLARSLRERLPSQAQVSAPPLRSEQASEDGTTKWLFDVGGGDAVETVYIPEPDRGTLCVSSQAGCAGGLPLLRHRPPRLQPQSEHRRNRRPALVRRARVAPAPRSGHGRARASEPRQPGSSTTS
jgi:hypothetical protein